MLDWRQSFVPLDVRNETFSLPWASLALKVRPGTRTRILCNNNASHVTPTKEPFSWGLRMGFPLGIEYPSGFGPYACDQPSSLGEEPVHRDTVHIKDFIYLCFHATPAFPSQKDCMTGPLPYLLANLWHNCVSLRPRWAFHWLTFNLITASSITKKEKKEKTIMSHVGLYRTR